jgi:hypothetical protein
MALSLVACETDDVEYFCPETDFSERNSLKDTMFIGTWQWHFTVRTCTYMSSEIFRDTIYPNEYVPWIEAYYPRKTFIIGSDIVLVSNNDTQSFCITDWNSSANGVDVFCQLQYRKLGEREASSYIDLFHRSGQMNPNMCRIEPDIHEGNACASTIWGYYSSTTDYFLKMP